MQSPVIFAGALPMEISGIKKRGSFRRAGHDRLTGFSCFEGEIGGAPAVLAVSGMGEENSYQAAKKILSLYPSARAYISVGLSAALVPELSPGDVVGASEITSAAVIPSSFPCDSGLIESVSKIKIRTGRFIAVSRTIITSSDKKKIASDTGAIALDMESGGAARARKEAGIPFISIRAISDDLDEDLPVDFNRFTDGGKMAWGRFILYLLAHPAKIPPLMRLGRNSRKACNRLGEVVQSFMKITPPRSPS